MRPIAPSRVRVVVPSTPSYLHSRAFDEVQLAITASLRDLGFNASSGNSFFYQDDELNIVVGPHLCRVLDVALPEGCILYNFEQAINEAWGWSAFAQMAQKSKPRALWEMSRESGYAYTDYFLQEPSIVSLGFHESMTKKWIKLQQIQERNENVVHCGSMNGRRSEVIHRIHQKTPVQVVPHGTYGFLRDKTYARAKLVVNAHFYEDSQFEQVRVAHLLANDVPVVTENSLGREEDLWRVPSSSFRELPDLVVELARDAEKLEQLSKMSFKAFRKTSMVENLRAALVASGVEIPTPERRAEP